MEAEAATAAAGSSNGTLAALGNSLANAGTATKAFVLTHPMGMAAAGGVLLGLGTYYAFGKLFGKKSAEPAPAAA